MPARPPSQPQLLIRYLFDSAEQARRHLHTQEDRQLLFVPGVFLDVRDGQRVLLEICFAGSEQTVTARATVYGVETGALGGAWLELPAVALFAGVTRACGVAARAHRRLAMDLVVRVGRPDQPGTVARLVNLSGGGARIVGAGSSWVAGDEIRFAELSSVSPLRGKVVWARGAEIGVELQRTDANTRRSATRLLDDAVRGWATAREVRHPGSCLCTRGGALLEPFLPRAAHRRVGGL